MTRDYQPSQRLAMWVGVIILYGMFVGVVLLMKWVLT